MFKRATLERLDPEETQEEMANGYETFKTTDNFAPYFSCVKDIFSSIFFFQGFAGTPGPPGPPGERGPRVCIEQFSIPGIPLR